jgi:hypothetical protein
VRGGIGLVGCPTQRKWAEGSPPLRPLLHNCLRYLTEAQNSICLRAFLPLNDIKLDVVAFFEALVSVELDCRVVDEDVRTVVTTDESVAFCIVEPFHLAFVRSHVPYLPPQYGAGEPQLALLRETQLGLVWFSRGERNVTLVSPDGDYGHIRAKLAAVKYLELST